MNFDMHVHVSENKHLGLSKDQSHYASWKTVYLSLRTSLDISKIIFQLKIKQKLTFSE